MPDPTGPDLTIARAHTGFAAAYGRTPDGVWSAPGRVNLIGEHTDYNDGFVLPLAIAQRTTAALATRTDRIVRITTALAPEIVERSIDAITPDAVQGWAAYPFGVVWALGEFGADLTAACGVDIHLDSNVPVGAGLSSSAAVECAVAVALNEVWALGFDRPTLARVGQLAENRVVGAPTGIMDQSASLLGARDAGVFLDCRSLDAELVPLGFADAGLTLLIVDTRVSHAHATGGYATRRASCDAGARTLGVESLRWLRLEDLARTERLLDDETFRRVRHVVTENVRVLDTVRTLREADPAAIGPLLDASHASMRDDFEISCPELDLAVETARTAGAIGARMTGGGFGGAAIALVPDAAVAAVSQAVQAAFGRAGYASPVLLQGGAGSRGASRDA